MPNLKHLILLPMLLLFGSMAQAEDTFNPDNPPEPSATYALTVSATPAGTANVSGKGRYKAGATVYVNTSATSEDYTFKHWLKDGEVYSTSRSFYYTMTEADVNFVAVYEFVKFNPDSPADPGASYKWRLYLKSDPPEASSFNINSGTKYEQGTTVAIRTYANEGFQFVGWFDGDTMVTSEKNFSLTMPSAETTLVARYRFNPGSPADPQGSQADIDNPQYTPGDVNNDGNITVVDVSMAVGFLLNKEPAGAVRAAADINSDSSITVVDVALIINSLLNSQE